MSWLRAILVFACLSVVVRPSAAAPAPSTPAPEDTSATAELRRQAKALESLVSTPLARRLLAATASVPSIAPRTVYHDSARTRYWSASEAAKLPAITRDSLRTRVLDEHFYYTTRYGSPLAYARPFELLARAGLGDVAGRKIVDFGYGTIGHLRLLASLGADVVGVEVDPLLRALYSEPGDQGAIAGRHGRDGSITLVHGRFPAEGEVTAAVGEGVDLFISKNTLKNGYIHPEQKVDPRMLVHLGVDDTTYVRTPYRILKPGGRAMIYNICPAPNAPGKPYIPWADGRCPFTREQWRAAGFRVIEFDRDDSEAVRRMGHALGWDQGERPMNLATDLFASYTLVEKPKR